MNEHDQFDAFDRDDDILAQRRQKRLEMKRKRIMRQRIILASAAGVLVLLLILLLSRCSKPKQPEIGTPPPTIPVVEEVKVQNVTATVSAVGDIMMYDTQIKAGQIDETTYDFSDSFKAVMAHTISPDLMVGNLELNFLGYAPYAGNPQALPYFNSPEVLASNLSAIGFDILQTANTYSIVNGITGLQSTINFLNQSSIDHVGTHGTNPAQSGSSGVVLREVNGIKIAFIGFTKGLNGFTLPTNNQYSVDLLYTDYNTTFEEINYTAIADRINAAKSHEPDVIIAMLHWGSEYAIFNKEDDKSTQAEIRDLMFKNGVDVILGSHSHVVGPMEMVDVKTNDGEEKKCFVAYSLGNFFSDMSKDFTQESVILNLEFTKDGETGDTEITDVNYVPLYILDRGEDATETRFEVLPIRKAIATSNFKEYEDVMNAAIENLKTNTASNYDSGE